jgi:hypothetical protein
MIKVNDLSIMQECLRDKSQICAMIEFVKNGGFWTLDVLSKFAKEKGKKNSPLIEIVKFPDEKYMIHDGHHRLVSIYLAGRDFVRKDEYVQKEWDYCDYLKINFENGWVTPFDPIAEIRLPDIYKFKFTALDLSLKNKEEAIKFILSNKNLYAKPRTISKVSSLAQTIGDLNVSCNF